MVRRMVETRNQNQRPAADSMASFGFRDVPEADKAAMVGEVFHSVARRYDLMNDVLSFGVHRVWKDRFVTGLRPRAGEAVLDLAGGTGDIAKLIHQRTSGQAHVTLCDINHSMVQVGRDRLLDQGLFRGIDWTVGDAETLPFDDASFDAVTIAFGIRNVTRIPKALTEIRRVLRPGGRFHCLEFSTVGKGLKPFYDAWSFQAMPRIGRVIADDPGAYRYLAESIRKFPAPQDFADMMTTAGMRRVGFDALTGGIAAIHRGWRI